MNFVLKKVIFQIAIKAIFKSFNGRNPLNRICELQFLSFFNWYRIFRCQVDFNNSVSVERYAQTSMGENVLKKKSHWELIKNEHQTFSILPCDSSLKVSPTIPHMGKSSRNISYQYWITTTVTFYWDRVKWEIYKNLSINRQFKLLGSSTVQFHIANTFSVNIDCKSVCQFSFRFWQKKTKKKLRKTFKMQLESTITEFIPLQNFSHSRRSLLCFDSMLRFTKWQRIVGISFLSILKLWNNIQALNNIFNTWGLW